MFRIDYVGLRAQNILFYKNKRSIFSCIKKIPFPFFSAYLMCCFFNLEDKFYLRLQSEFFSAP